MMAALDTACRALPRAAREVAERAAEGGRWGSGGAALEVARQVVVARVPMKASGLKSLGSMVSRHVAQRTGTRREPGGPGDGGEGCGGGGESIAAVGGGDGKGGGGGGEGRGSEVVMAKAEGNMRDVPGRGDEAACAPKLPLDLPKALSVKRSTARRLSTPYERW